MTANGSRRNSGAQRVEVRPDGAARDGRHAAILSPPAAGRKVSRPRGGRSRAARARRTRRVTRRARARSTRSPGAARRSARAAQALADVGERVERADRPGTSAGRRATPREERRPGEQQRREHDGEHDVDPVRRHRVPSTRPMQAPTASRARPAAPPAPARASTSTPRQDELPEREDQQPPRTARAAPRTRSSRPRPGTTGSGASRRSSISLVYEKSITSGNAVVCSAVKKRVRAIMPGRSSVA